MSCILSIETSSNLCSVALSNDGECLYKEINREEYNSSATLGGYVESALSFADSHAIPLEYVAVSGGPGSYTGLRTGVSIAKGVCYGREIPLIAVPTLEILTVPVLLYNDEVSEETLLCPMLDARRMDVFCALYTNALHNIMPTNAMTIDENSFAEQLETQKIIFFGNGSDKCKDVIKHKNAMFVPRIEPLAHNMFPLAEKRIAENKIEDTAYYTPFYLKEFVAKTPKKLL